MEELTIKISVATKDELQELPREMKKLRWDTPIIRLYNPIDSNHFLRFIAFERHETGCYTHPSGLWIYASSRGTQAQRYNFWVDSSGEVIKEFYTNSAMPGHSIDIALYQSIFLPVYEVLKKIFPGENFPEIVESEIKTV